ncbi:MULTISPECIES: hypothetical protein [Klebsiella]|uniref:Pectate lyase superfamily protein domain-containing protein n=2 Tax=Klebsiella grimontii TaxID=2058152 RepID=A0A285AUP2_9ENTR|nr:MULTISPECIES: hypothetical protein [Klebsiella]ELQ8330506.1 hypothetical protein [Klebsiella oxytoca]MCW9662774.1 hypothetical protein [Klebsiella oxytoca]QLP06239.1 hypothetical protein HV042_03845 [Klebsiella grimontii]SAQ17539.1 Uncharacterised protein [Klebsiella oxytoca]SNU32382.1 conserved hypothetical protein [Klebsiella grimontii]
MYHLDNTSGVPEMPEPKETQSISTRWFGESQEQGGISWPGADWFNIVQAELLAILELVEDTPDKTKYNQIATAIKNFSGGNIDLVWSTLKIEGARRSGLTWGGTTEDGIKSITPFMFGGQGNSPDIDNTDAVLNAVAVAKELSYGIDLRGGPWRISKTIDLTGIRHIITDFSGRFLLDPENFSYLHDARFAVTFGNPDTRWSDDRAVNVCVNGLLQIQCDSRNSLSNGIFIKGALITIEAMRATGFNGHGIFLGSVWDSAFKSVSVELCGNIASYAFQISAFGDTSNCLWIGRLQVERAYHKQMGINVIRSEIHTIHAERLMILTTDDGTTLSPSGLTYQNSNLLLSNSVLGQVVLDAMSSDDAGTVSITPAVTLNLYASFASALSMNTSIVSSTYGDYAAITASSFRGYYNHGQPITICNSRMSYSDGSGVCRMVNGVLFNCTIDKLIPHYGTNGLTVISSTIISDFDIAADTVNNITFYSCMFNGAVKRTQSPAGKPVTFIDCNLAQLNSYYQHKADFRGGYIAQVNLASRAFVNLSGVRGAIFSYVEGGDRGFTTNDCIFDSVTRWGPPTHGSFPACVRTQRLGNMNMVDNKVVTTVVEYINTANNGVSFAPLLTYTPTS